MTGCSGNRTKIRIIGRRYCCRDLPGGKGDKYVGQSSNSCCKTCFYNYVSRDLVTSTTPCFTPEIDVSPIKTYSILVVNTGPGSALVQPEISPDGQIWSSFGEMPYIITPGGKQLIIPQFFLRYVRLKYITWRSSCNTRITVWLQGQG
ncbi:MAG: DUF6385 domain-containing protein [Bacillota bacterium]